MHVQLSALATMLVAAIACPAAAAPLVRYDATGPAELVMTGNTLGLAGEPAAPSTADRIGAFIDADLVLQVPGWPLGTTADWTLASSDAVLDLPEGATIIYAELVWGGTLDIDLLAVVDQPVRLRTPSGAEHDVAPDPVSAGDFGGSQPGVGYYGRSANVTSRVEGAGTYRVGAVPTVLDDADAAAGWSLYVVYRAPGLAPRRVALFTVMATVEPGVADADVTAEVAGVCVPTAGPDRDASIALSVMDGDANIVGDAFLFAGAGDQLDDGARLALDGIAPDNLYGGRITDRDGQIDNRGSFGSSNHGASTMVAGARQGWDALTVSGTDRVAPTWRSAFLRGSTGNDQHGLVAVGLSMAQRTPWIPAAVMSATPGTSAPSGDVTVRVELENVGQASAEGVVFDLPNGLTRGVTYVGDSFLVGGSAPPTGLVRDQTAFLAGVGIGSIDAGETVAVTFRLNFGATDVASWGLVPYVTYLNGACPDALTEPLVASPLVFAFAVCGDGRREGTEACDDGDDDSGDGCSAGCDEEAGWSCGDNPESQGTPAAPDSRCVAGCGDGTFAESAEGCDDGDHIGGDGCSSSCAVEVGWTCDEPALTSVCSPICGDGRVLGDEECDDGDASESEPDGCAADCGSVDHGWECLGAPSNCRVRCGDGVVAAGAEACDDENRQDGDGCDSDCALEDGWSCEDEPSECDPTCGDGLLRSSEACDDGGALAGDGCDASCRSEAGFLCAQIDDDLPTDCARDTDGDGVPDDDDNCPEFANADQTFPPADDPLCPPYRGPRTRGGGGCAGGSLSLLGLMMLALARARARTRSRVHTRALALALALGLTPEARAQEFDPRIFEPTLSPLGVLGVETSATSAHLRPWVNLVATVADDELFTQLGPDAYSQGPIDYRFMLTFGAGIGLFDRLDLAIGFPLAVAETYSATFGEEPSGDMGMTDLRLLLRGRVFGPEHGGTGPGIALALHLTLPTGSDTPFMSDGAVTAMPQVVLDYRSEDGFLAALNVGYRIRPERTVGDLTVGHELRFALGAEVPIGFYGFAFTGEIDGAVSLADTQYDDGGIDEREVPVELLGGMRWRSRGGVTISGAVGGGLTAGYGAPDFRLLFGIAFNVPPPDKYEEPIVPASRNEVRDDWHTGLPPDRTRAPEITSERFDQLAANDNDSDSDAVAVPADVCPTIEEDRDGFNDDDGCPDPDNDEDGVFDADDMCPNEQETLNGNEDYDGCFDEPKPIVGKGIRDNQIEITNRIQFKPGSAELLESDKVILDQVALVMRANASIKRFRIEGHTDNRGDKEFNVDLAERRAWSVRTYLIDKGIEEDRLFPKGFGSTRPVAKNSSEAGRMKNRRVEFHVIQEGEPSEGDVP